MKKNFADFFFFKKFWSVHEKFTLTEINSESTNFAKTISAQNELISRKKSQKINFAFFANKEFPIKENKSRFHVKSQRNSIKNQFSRQMETR